MAQVVITVDTEIGEHSKYTPRNFETFVEGKVDGREVGYRFILDILEKYGAKGEFFVDVYPYGFVGESRFETLCGAIHSRGHSVQLHTHPSMAFDERRSFLYQYSLEEQVNILALGVRKITEWIGVHPIAHRAGMYGINKDTFEALEKVGILYDCSCFYGNQNCRFQSNIKNKVFHVGNVTEIPVTVFKQVVSNRNRITGFGKFISWRRMGRKEWSNQHFHKLDIRHSATVSEIKEVITQSNPDAIIILFLHSFNFLDLVFNLRKRKYESIRVNDSLVRAFEELLGWISKQKSCRFNTIKDLRIDYGQNDECIEINNIEHASVIKSLVNLFETRILLRRYL